ncbi:MAG TPA: aminotransferase class I/II-fold pyridoxal phosphate-dependent enzyme [Terriglobales bacterium]|nr:aminotransferase class I/II-fold pyridoxal phosphate-dependent enzyme [Terriglobales bacterium]
MRIDLFKMERTQCLFENEVEYNLSESGVLPVRIEEVLGGAEDAAKFLSLGLKYAYSNGSPELRQNIATWYPGATADHVTVTNGGSEANYISVWGLLEKTDRAAVMLPNYMQTWGLARAYAGRADAFWLKPRRENGKMRWGLDLEGLRRAVSKKTKLITVCNPNNPTGAVLTEEEMDEIVAVARKANAWLLVDEIYRGAEAGGPLTPTFWGRFDKLLITSGLSKAFGMPGLRLGWIVGPPKMIAKVCSYHDYTTLSPSTVSEHLARIVMEPMRREKILQRTRAIIRKQLPALERWIHTHDDIFTYIPPVAAAIAYVGYKLPIKSEALMTKLIQERSVLITPGEHFAMGKYIRIGYGYDIEHTLRGLARVDLTLEELQKKAAPRQMRVAATRSGAA